GLPFAAAGSPAAAVASTMMQSSGNCLPASVARRSALAMGRRGTPAIAAVHSRAHPATGRTLADALELAPGPAPAASPPGPKFKEPRTMKILVGYKRVVDFNVRIQVKPDGSGVVTEGVKLSPNPFDEIALEEALRLRDSGTATEVVVATIAPANAQPHLRNGLAMGANRAIHVVTDQSVQPLEI